MDLMTFPEQAIRTTLEFFRRMLDRNFFISQEEGLEKAAGWAAPLTALMGLLLSVIAAIKLDSFKAFLAGVAWIFLVCVGFFIGRLFVGACRKLIRNNPSTISSSAFLDSLGLMLVISLAGVVLWSVYTAIEASSVEPLVSGFFASVALVYAISIVLNPSIISTSVQSQSTAGDDALAIMVVIYKAAVRMAGVIFGSSLIIGSLLLGLSIFRLVSGDLSELLVGGLQSISGVLFTLGGLMYPFLVYISFVFFYLLVDLCRAILSLHSRQAPTEPVEEEAAGPSNIPPAVIRNVLIVFLGLVVATAAVVKGKEYYAEYQVRAEVRRIEAEQARLAEEQARLEAEARLAEEQEREKAEAAARAEQAAFVSAVQQFVGKPAAELIRSQSVNEMFRELFANQYGAYETYLTNPAPVVSVDGLLFAPACRTGACAAFKTIAVVDPQQRSAFAVVSTNGNLSYFGVEEAALPASVRDWIAANW